MNLTRRHVVTALLVGATAAPVVAFSPPTLATGPMMSAPQALQAAQEGKVVLVDVRTRGEWKQTGIAEPALAISMHEPGFVDKLKDALGQDTSRPLALICATGGRSRAMQLMLTNLGFDTVIDVSEGMLGSSVGPGWLKRGLPVRPWQP